MNAQLKPITGYTLQRPRYQRPDLLGTYRDDWLKVNRNLLRGWYDACSFTLCESEPAVSFEEFARTQHDTELMLKEAYRETHRGWL